MTAPPKAASKTRVALSTCAVGHEVRLSGIRAGRELRSRLAAMGLVPGIRIRVMSREGRGPLVLALRGMRLAVGRGIAEKMDVEPWSTP